LWGTEIVDSTARLCAMNLFLHGIGGSTPDAASSIEVRDSLAQEPSKHVSMVMTNPPFGKKSSITMIGDDGKAVAADITISRPDFWATTSNKQLNFVQHVRSMLEINGTAAMVVPDNVLYDTGVGEKIRRRLLQDCDVHTLLRLPNGLFYANTVLANVLFFERRAASLDAPSTREVWVYDFRTNQHFTLKTQPVERQHLDDFVALYRPGERHKREEAENFRRWTFEELDGRPDFNLDVWAYVEDRSLDEAAQIPPPEVLAEEIITTVSAALNEFATVAAEFGVDLDGDTDRH
jgi:type I restriction enzyme M protein